MSGDDLYYFTQINGTDHEVQENASDGSRFCYTCNTTVDGDPFHDPQHDVVIPASTEYDASMSNQPHQHHTDTQVVRTVGTSRQRGICDCGWRGRLMTTRRDAEEDADEHVREMAGS